MNEPVLFHVEHLSGREPGTLAEYQALLEEENAAHNLISRQLKRGELERLLQESFTLGELIPQHWPDESTFSMVDLGSGGGLLGIPVALANPARKLLLVESNLKKCQALHRMAQHLGLEQLSVRHERVERIRDTAAPSVFMARFFMDPRGVAIATRRWRQAGTAYLLVCGKEEEAAADIYDLTLVGRHSLSAHKDALHYVAR